MSNVPPPLPPGHGGNEGSGPPGYDDYGISFGSPMPPSDPAPPTSYPPLADPPRGYPNQVPAQGYPPSGYGPSGYQAPPPGYLPPGTPGVGSVGYTPPAYVTHGYHPYGTGAYRPREHPQAITILVLGILSIVLCQLLGPVAWYMGGKARREIRFAGVPITNSGMVTAGWILGIISSLIIIFVFIAVVLIGTLGSSSSSTLDVVRVWR